MPNEEDSVFKLGYTDYIRKVAHNWLKPRNGPTPFNSIELSFPERIARLY